MRKSLKAAVIALILTGMATTAPALANDRKVEATWRWKQCRMQGLTETRWSAREERLTAICVTDRWTVPGGWPEFSKILSCESGWNRLAYNPNGPYVGLAQHALSAWSGRVRTYSPNHWTLNPSWRNSRTMLVVTARMMAQVGLSPWSCA